MYHLRIADAQLTLLLEAVGAVDSLFRVRKPRMGTPGMYLNPGPVERWLQYVWLDPTNGTEVPVVSFTTRLSYVLPRRGGRGGLARIPPRAAPSATVTRETGSTYLDTPRAPSHRNPRRNRE